jgi:hypothetical protein
MLKTSLKRDHFPYTSMAFWGLRLYQSLPVANFEDLPYPYYTSGVPGFGVKLPEKSWLDQIWQ